MIEYTLYARIPADEKTADYYNVMTQTAMILDERYCDLGEPTLKVYERDKIRTFAGRLGHAGYRLFAIQYNLAKTNIFKTDDRNRRWIVVKGNNVELWLRPHVQLPFDRESVICLLPKRLRSKSPWEAIRLQSFSLGYQFIHRLVKA